MPNFTINPDNPCAHCDSSKSNTTWTPNDGASCSTDKCTVGQTCSAFACAGGQPRNCSDGNTCTTDTCDPEQPGDGCIHTALPDDTRRDDRWYCNGIEYCHGGVLQRSGSPCSGDASYCIEDSDTCVQCTIDAHCNDGNACTSNICDTASGTCSNPLVPNGSACNDGVLCTINDKCMYGQCYGTKTSSCGP